MSFFKGYAKDINRLITSLNPAGKILFQDGFENTLVKWGLIPLASGAGGGGARDTTKAFSGEACYKISSGTVAAGGYELIKMIPPLLPKQRRLGLECWFAVPSTSQEIYFGLEKWEGTTLRRCDVRLRPDSKLFSVRSSGADPYSGNSLGTCRILPLDGSPADQYAQAFNYVKLVADLNINKYVSVQLNDSFFDLSKYAVREDTVGADYALAAYFLWFNQAVIVSADCFIDDVLVTYEEPQRNRFGELVEGMVVRFTVRIRRVGGYYNKNTGTVRESLGFTIPTVICEDLHLKKDDKVEVQLRKGVK